MWRINLDKLYTPVLSSGSPIFNEPATVHGVTRDDLIRLVVGMQWREAVTLQGIANEIDGGSMYGIHPRLLSRLPPASTIVDEWLGVRS